MKKFFKGIAGMLLLFGIIACGPGQKKSEQAGKNVDNLLFPMTYESNEKEIKGGEHLR